MTRAICGLFLLLGSLGSAVSTARADGIDWRFSYECEAGEREVDLFMHCSTALDCVERTERLYGCSDSSSTAELVGDSIEWRDLTCTCYCMIGQGSFACDDTPVCEEPNDYWKCSYEARTTLALPCDTLHHDTLCTEPTCPEGDPYWDWFCAGDICYATCANVSGGTSSSPPESPDSTDSPTDSGGCGVATAGGSGALGRANLGVLLTLLLFLLGALHIARRMSARPPRR